jgi:multisubunit Na+/H+ antiporter MnhB subunit
MDDLISLANAAGCGLIAVALMWAVLSPDVHDGVVIKCGLILMALGFGAVAVRMLDPWSVDGVTVSEALSRSILLINIGAAVTFLGYRWRTRHKPPVRRRASDWADLDSRGHA